MAAARQIRCLYDERLCPLDLNLSQASLLAHIQEFGPDTQTALAERLGIGRAATGTIVDQLESRTLVERQADPADRRVWRIGLTDRGRLAADDVATIDAAVRRELRAGIPREDRQQLAEMLVQIQRNVATGLDRPPTNPTPQNQENPWQKQ